MYFKETQTSVLIIHNNPEEALELKELIKALFPNKILEIYLFENPNDAIFSCESLSDNEPVSLIIFGDDKGSTQSLLPIQKLHQILPDAMIIALITYRHPQLIEELKIVNFIYRYFILPYDLTELTNTLLSAYQYYEQRFELREKNRILSEIHRAAMSLIGERDLSKCLHKLMRIVIDNANAEKGYLILPSSENPEELLVVAEGTAGSYETQLEQIVLNENTNLPLIIIEHSIKAKENIILDDARSHNIFGLHPLIQKLELKSILCSPLIYQGNLVGVLYLQNQSITGAFSPYTMELFRLLSAPAAIAIQNAKLYNDLEKKVIERTKEIHQKNLLLEAQKAEIHQKNEDILNSINYAKRIQDAFLPKISDIEACFKDSFVFYKPKDIVSGDFFWFNQKLSKVIIACADCTGHGIPGAFMSIMANTILRQIVEVEGIFRPDEILELLHARIRIALQQDETHSKDGMDIAICQIDIKRQKLNFAGARRPLLIIRGNEFAEIKPDKFSVGGEQEEDIRKYTNYALDLEPHDRLYLFTDGFSDQFNETHKKYQTRRFYQFLLESRRLNMQEQKKLLEQELLRWQANEEQTDDILVIGMEI